MAALATVTKQLTAASTTNICLAQTPLAAGNLTLNGALVTAGVAILDTQRRVGITSAANESARTFTIYGTDDAGTVISETVTGANIGVASSLRDYKRVTRIAVDAATAGAMTVGTTAVGSTPWIVPDDHITPFEVAAAYELISGAVTCDVEYTDESVLMPIPVYDSSQMPPIATATGWSGLTNLAANASAVVTHVCAGLRLKVTAGTGKGQLTLRQSGIRN